MKTHSYQTHSYISTLAKIREKRQEAIAAEMHSDAAHWRNCEVALEQMAQGPRRWGPEICLADNER